MAQNDPFKAAHQSHQRAFTLIEVLATVVVIAVLFTIAVNVSTYAHNKAADIKTRSMIAAITAALEQYKSDWGYYPPTGPARLSACGVEQHMNNSILLFALDPIDYLVCTNNGTGVNDCYTITSRRGRKTYLSFARADIVNELTWVQDPTTAAALGIIANSNGVPNIVDGWRNPFVYYNSPTTPFAFSNYPSSIIITAGFSAMNVPSLPGGGYVLGGQVNVTSYDLFSLGRDRKTAVPGAPAATWVNVVWRNISNAFDDVTNWGQ